MRYDAACGFVNIFRRKERKLISLLERKNAIEDGIVVYSVVNEITGTMLSKINKDQTCTYYGPTGFGKALEHKSRCLDSYWTRPGGTEFNGPVTTLLIYGGSNMTQQEKGAPRSQESMELEHEDDNGEEDCSLLNCQEYSGLKGLEFSTFASNS
ncbi:hypothetical protein STEG23_032724 [Scotinomys teguina]